MTTQKRPKMILISSPYSGHPGGIREATLYAQNCARYARHEATRRYGSPPPIIVPHLLFPQFMDDEVEADRRRAMTWIKEMLGPGTELWIFDDYNISRGMAEEMAAAIHLGAMIDFFQLKSDTADKTLDND